MPGSKADFACDSFLQEFQEYPEKGPCQSLALAVMKGARSTGIIVPTYSAEPLEGGCTAVVLPVFPVLQPAGTP